MTADSTTHGRHPAIDLIRAGLLTAVVAAFGALTLAVLLGFVGVELQVPAEPGGTELQALPLFPVVIAAALPVLVGTIVYAIVRWRSQRPVVVWRVVAAGVTLLSLAPLLGVGGAVTNQVGLGLLHVAVGTVAAVLLPRFADDA